MLGIVVPLIVSWYVYKQAKENGYNGTYWALINFAVFFGAQLLFGFALGLAIALGIPLFNWDQELLEKLMISISLLGLVAGAFCSWLVVRHVARVPEERFNPEPPPPPKFN